MEKTVKWFAAAAGAVAGLFMRMPIAIRLLVLLMVLFYIVNESLSILENAVLLGVPVPQKLTQVLDVAKWTSNSEKEEPQNEKQDE